MKRYEQLAHDIADLINTEVLRVGERVPSVRQASNTYRVSPSTVYQAYYLLENRGLIRAKPRSGYFVCKPSKSPNSQYKRTTRSITPTQVDVSELVFSVLGLVSDPEIVPLGSAFPSPTLFPMNRLAKSLTKTTRSMDMRAVTAHLPAGSLELRRQIVQRYAIADVQVPIDEIVITGGALEALNLCLQAVTQPGDYVAVEAPAFYASLQALERLQLKAVEIPVIPGEGIDLETLASAIEKYPIKACWMMSNFQNPTGATLSDEKKQALVNLLTEHKIPLLEDDVYNELYFARRAPKPAKAYDREGYVMHCSSFSKNLAPGYRVGWTCAGRFTQKVERLKLMTTLSPSVPAQLAIADYLQFGGFDRHLRKLRHQLEVQQNQMRDAIERYFPQGTVVSQPDGGYFLWLELSENIDSLLLFQKSLEAKISIAPGPIFSATQRFRHCIRINYGCEWSPQIEAAIETLGAITHALDVNAKQHT